ncbi:hypothetical protein LOC67_09355 [Stieleria sp. JC731]|uniref:hypothetical protein n=1 Tax=Pirellulaceae TaxID=2691357 RepID=UPI001E4EE6C5|nr:hypothetical protein [Stieleria sp. JC731]MCC9600770.1 hypothetical protein [Stieleria sp. JC731]
MTNRPTFHIELKADHDDCQMAVRGLREILKRLGRNHGLKCVHVHEITIDTETTGKETTK